VTYIKIIYIYIYIHADTETKINGCLTNAVDKGYLPISLDNSDKERKTLKTDNIELYKILLVKKK
jgi:hypothetical protein